MFRCQIISCCIGICPYICKYVRVLIFLKLNTHVIIFLSLYSAESDTKVKSSTTIKRKEFLIKLSKVLVSLSINKKKNICQLGHGWQHSVC